MKVRTTTQFVKGSCFANPQTGTDIRVRTFEDRGKTVTETTWPDGSRLRVFTPTKQD